MSNQDFLWWRDGVIYQIYPRSFADSNNDGIGDLNGIISRLDYLKDLGVDALWLSPIYPSPDADFGYDVSDYCGIDPKYGTMADFDRLLEETHRRDMRMVLDLVLNHTSDQHPWFLEARQSRDNPRRDWYIWRDPAPGGGAPNNWAARFGGCAWDLDPLTGQYYLHMFTKQQPDLNWRNPEVRQAMLDVFRFWLDKGVDGFRLDVFNVYFKHPELPSNPPRLGLIGWDRQQHTYDYDQPEMMPLLAEIRALVDSYPQRYLVGETFEATPARAASYIGTDKLHAAFNFTFTHSRWNARQFLRSILDWENSLGAGEWPNYVMSNHDLPRSATRYGRGENDDRLKVAATLLMTQRGTPFLYYGEEIGMRDFPITQRSQIKDPLGKRYFPFHKGRDGCRSPMQWGDALNAGFSEAEPWMPVHPNYRSRNVEDQLADPDSLLHTFCKLIRLRREVPALRNGMLIPLIYDPRSLLAYLRKTKDQTILVVLNFRNWPNRLALSGTISGPQWRCLYSSQNRDVDLLTPRTLQLAPNEALILEQR